MSPVAQLDYVRVPLVCCGWTTGRHSPRYQGYSLARSLPHSELSVAALARAPTHPELLGLCPSSSSYTLQPRLESHRSPSLRSLFRSAVTPRPSRPVLERGHSQGASPALASAPTRRRSHGLGKPLPRVRYKALSCPAATAFNKSPSWHKPLEPSPERRRTLSCPPQPWIGRSHVTTQKAIR
jgi:hypothetical protein